MAKQKTCWPKRCPCCGSTDEKAISFLGKTGHFICGECGKTWTEFKCACAQ